MHGRRRKRVSEPTPLLSTDRADAGNVNAPLGEESPLKLFGRRKRRGGEGGAQPASKSMFGGITGILGAFTGGKPFGRRDGEEKEGAMSKASLSKTGKRMLGQKDDPDASVSAKDAVAGVFGTRSEGVQEQSPQASNNATAKEVARS